MTLHLEKSAKGLYNAAAWLLDRNLNEGRGASTAIRYEGQAQTYEDVLRDVWRVQHACAAVGVRAGERVALIVDDEPGFISWFIGSLRSGAIPVPVSTMLGADELSQIIRDSEAGTVVVSEMYVCHLPSIVRQAPALRVAVVLGTAVADIEIPQHNWFEFNDDAEAHVYPTRADSPAFWLYTSGTTGSPKGAMHRHASLEATAVTYARSILAIGPSDSCLSVAKLFFAYGLGNSLTFPFSVGATAILAKSRPTPASFSQLMMAEGPSLFFAVPGFIAGLLDADLPDNLFATVRLSVSAGEALPPELHRRFVAGFNTPLLDGIGSTEALHIFLSNRVGDEQAGATGVPVPGYEVKLLDQSDREITGAENPGYLHVKGPSTATGYWSCREATHAAFRGEWLRTGDVYIRSVDGHYTFLGRDNDMMKVGGIWVSPAEVEGVLVEHPDVLEAAIVGHRGADGLETSVAFVVARAGHTIDLASIEAHCRQRMAAFKRPRQVVEVNELPKTPTGKVRRFELRDGLAKSSSSATSDAVLHPVDH